MNTNGTFGHGNQQGSPWGLPHPSPGSQPSASGWGATGSQPSAPHVGYQNAAGYPSNPGGPFNPDGPGGPGGGGYPGGPGQPPRRKSNLTPLIAGGVGLALIAAVTTGVLVNRGRNEPQPGPSSSLSTTSAGSSPVTTSSVKAPGKGTYASVMEMLDKEQFDCTDEQTQGIKSSICTHFGTAPYMVVYVGAAGDDSLGRLSLEVQDDVRATEAKALSKKLISAFATDDQAAEIETEIARTTTGWSSNKRVDDLRYRGNARGSVVMWVEDWVPQQTQPNFIRMSPDQMKTILEGYGYTCTSDGSLQQCDKTLDGVEYRTVHATTGSGEGLSRLSLRVRSKTPDKARPLFQTEAKKILAALPEGQGTQIQNWMARQSMKTGDMEFVDGRIVDYYPSSTSEGMQSGAFYLWETCWTDVRVAC